MDGDIFGPSVAIMMNIKEQPLIDENNMIIPPINFGVKCLGMGLLIEDSSAVIWRGEELFDERIYFFTIYLNFKVPWLCRLYNVF